MDYYYTDYYSHLDVPRDAAANAGGGGGSRNFPGAEGKAEQGNEKADGRGEENGAERGMDDSRFSLDHSVARFWLAHAFSLSEDQNRVPVGDFCRRRNKFRRRL